MAQQTRLDTMRAYYERFLKQYPDVFSLAKASREDVYKQWEGLGYYKRARNLHETARIIVEKYHGVFPDSLKQLKALPRPGAYPSRALASIRFPMPVCAVDGNVLRVFARLTKDHSDIHQAVYKKHVQTTMDEIIDRHRPGDFNQALMDLGALVCTPRNPRCESCPLHKACQAYLHHEQEQLPFHVTKKHPRGQSWFCAVLEYQGAYYMKKAPEGLLAGLYGFPLYEMEDPELIIVKEFPYQMTRPEHLGDVDCAFTHVTWHLHIYRAAFLEKPDLKLYTSEELRMLPVAAAFQKVFSYL